MDIFSKQDIEYMKRAIALAEKGRGSTDPNPMVGAVIVKDRKIISEGYHKKAGSPHAEIEAITGALIADGSGSALEGSTIYVSLEPCTVFGKTPPCVNEIVKYGLREVVVAVADPNPEVNGKGIKFLEKSGIRVRTGLLESEARKQNEIFFKHISTGIPFVCAKIASSLDGKLATRSSDSKWITSHKSRLEVQKMRKDFGCVLTGINTIIKDNPVLFPKKDPDLRGDFKDNILGIGKDFNRVILDSQLKIGLDSNIVKTSKIINTIIFTNNENMLRKETKIAILKKNGIQVIFTEREIARDDCMHKKAGSLIAGSLKLEGILKTLYSEFGITKLLLESGPTLLTSFLRQSLIDKFIIFLAPKILGGENRYDMFGDLGIEKVGSSIKLKFDGIKKVDSDIKITAYPEYSFADNL